MLDKMFFVAFVIGCLAFAGGLSWWVIQEAIAVDAGPAGVAMVAGAMVIVWSIILGMLLAK